MMKQEFGAIEIIKSQLEALIKKPGDLIIERPAAWSRLLEDKEENEDSRLVGTNNLVAIEAKHFSSRTIDGCFSAAYCDVLESDEFKALLIKEAISQFQREQDKMRKDARELLELIHDD